MKEVIKSIYLSMYQNNNITLNEKLIIVIITFSTVILITIFSLFNTLNF